MEKGYGTKGLCTILVFVDGVYSRNIRFNDRNFNSLNWVWVNENTISNYLSPKWNNHICLF